MKFKITDHVQIYLSNAELYFYASKYWDGKVDKYSLSSAIRKALSDKDCPEDIDPFESLVDCDLYANEQECNEYYN